MLNVRFSSQRGMTLVELMIGLTIGLLILAGSTGLFVNYINSNRSLLLMTRLTQEMRAATELIERDVRRAGFWQNAVNGVWYKDTTGVVSNPYTIINTSTDINYSYALDADDTAGANEAFGFRRVTDNGIGRLEMLKSGNWIAVTNIDATDVTSFSITPVVRTISLAEYCINPCPTGSTTCPPQMTVRNYNLVFTAQSRSDNKIARKIEESIKVRNDVVTGACAP